MKFIPVIIFCVFLAACQTTTQTPVLTKTEYVGIKIPKSLDNCPNLIKLPNPDTLTDGQVAKALVASNTNNRKCRNTVDAIYSYVDRANKEIEQTQVK